MRELRIARSIGEIGRARWESVFPRVAEGFDYLRASDQELSRQFSHYYVTIAEGERMLLAAPCFLMEYPVETTVEGGLRAAIGAASRVVPGLLKPKILFCGCTVCEGRIGYAADEPSLALALGEALLSIATAERAAFVVFKDFGEEYLPFLSPLSKLGFHRVASFPSVELELDFSTVDEYLASLSKSTRKGLRRKFRDLAGKDIRFSVRDDPGPYLERIYALYLNTLGKSGVQFEKLTPGFFAAVGANMPGVAKYFLWEAGGELVAFDLCLVSDGILVDEYVGMDYSCAYEYHLYYLTFRDLLSWCLANGIRKYESGALNYDPKKRLDMRFVNRYLFVRHLNPVLNRVLSPLYGLIEPSRSDPALRAAALRR